MENARGHLIHKEIIAFLEELIPDYPVLKLQVKQNEKVSKISNSSETYRSFEYDIVIYKCERPFIIYEVKDTAFFKKVKKQVLISQASSALELTKASYYIFTDGLQYFLIDGTKFFKYSEIEKQGVIKLLEKAPEQKTIRSNIKFLFDTLKSEFIRINSADRWDELVGDKKPSAVFEYDANTSKYSFIGNPLDLSGEENLFFQKLLPIIEGEVAFVYRYTTGSGLESLLKNNTFRMNGIVGQNDPTEVDYFDEYIFGGRKPLDELPPEQLEQINKVFISSCVLEEKGDDLTMWRLYAEDSKGVCYKLKVHNERFNHHILLKPVSYGDKDCHKELDVIKNLLTKFKDERSVNFEFKTLETWKHFFKPFQYKVEEEIRLLYIKNETLKPKEGGWVVTFTDKIYNPFVDFKLNSTEFPLELDEITLGPNSPYKNVNKAQLKEYIRQLKLKMKLNTQGVQEQEYQIQDLDVIISEINNYRKT